MLHYINVYNHLLMFVVCMVVCDLCVTHMLCRYGLETVSQLFADGCLGHSHIDIEDHPDYRHRGFMLDTG